MNIEITCITVILGRRGDKLFLVSTLPEGEYPFKGSAALLLKVDRGSGVEYCAANFPGVPVTVVQA